MSGNLWWYYEIDKKWIKQNKILLEIHKTNNIIEDKYFELRKAFALDEIIQLQMQKGHWVDCDEEPSWCFSIEDYRIKPKEPVYEWQYTYMKQMGLKIIDCHWTF